MGIERERRENIQKGYYSQANGRSYTYITCPFCGEVVKAYIWSLCGGGKKCPCGALHGSMGVTFAPKIKI